VDRIFGSETALGVLRRGACPVLAVPAEAAGTLAHAVAAVDFSAASVRAAEAAVDLLSDGGTLTALHVRPRTSALLSGGVAVLTAWEEAYTRRTDELLGRLTAMIRARRPDVRVTGMVRTGAPADVALAVAGEVGADLIATGTQGPGAVERLIVGSVSTAIIRRATVAVLACGEPSPTEVARIERSLFGVTEQTDHASWAALLADVTLRNAGRTSTVEVDDPMVGARTAERGYAFTGGAYDRHDRRIELMFADPVDPSRHLTRSLARVEVVQVETGPDGRDRAVRIQHGAGRTTVTFG
jgi:nucleotide-binding universal stress UspA family protein